MYAYGFSERKHHPAAPFTGINRYSRVVIMKYVFWTARLF